MIGTLPRPDARSRATSQKSAQRTLQDGSGTSLLLLVKLRLEQYIITSHCLCSGQFVR